MIFPIFFFLLGFISFVNTQSFPNWEELDGEGKVFLGWEFDSKTELITFQMQDYIGQGFVTPKMDLHNDWILLEGVEVGGKTTLKFSRLINSCDEEDYPIGIDTTRLIWAYGDTDEIKYHSATRRARMKIFRHFLHKLYGESCTNCVPKIGRFLGRIVSA
ncbi:DBH-like monooxygenase protein 2 [Folsomia candida]|uniref:DBH-like monooxygenase protein 2 n=1 Tax=Folsomia candida TaxID=158441 RepID=A0A226DRQ4_FOLCA|nr:DBH-like monooxygenase protein 2 [Folsomia candida]